MKYYDLIIIGAGGGAKLRPSADLGKKIAIIEKDKLGGTCLNRGCIPSKMLIYPSDLLTHFKEDAKKLFIDGNTNHKINFPKLVSWVNEKIDSQSDNIQPIYDNHKNIDYYHGEGQFVENKVIKVNGELLSAHKIYIATGSRPHIPDIKGLSKTPFFTSRELLKNKVLPKKMVVIGGGYIATELGHFYGAAGSDVHFIVRSELLKNEDKDIRSEFTRSFKNRYNLHFGLSPKEVIYKNKTFYTTVINKDGESNIIESDALFVATGVVPNTQGLGLENTSVVTNKHGYIEVNDHLETHANGVYALGDVVGNYLFRHSVNFEGEYLLEQHYNGALQAPILYPSMPHAVFSYPQIAGVGLTEDQLIKMGKKVGDDYYIGFNSYNDSAMGMASKPEAGLVKIISDSNGKLLGAHIVGEKASDIIGILIVYVSQGAYVQDILKQIIFIHPALSEVIRNALRKLNGQLKKEA